MKFIVIFISFFLSFNILCDTKSVFGITYNNTFYFDDDLYNLDKKYFYKDQIDKYQFGLSWYLFVENTNNTFSGLSIKAKYDWFYGEKDNILIHKYDIGLTLLSINEKTGGYTFRMTIAPSFVFSNIIENKSDYLFDYSDKSFDSVFGFTLEFGFGYGIVMSDGSFVIGEIGLSFNFDSDYGYFALTTSLLF